MPEKITLGEMKELIKEEKILPSDLFGVEDLTGDPLVRGYLDSSVKQLKGKLSGEFEARKRIEKGTEHKEETWEEQKKKLEDENKLLKIESATTKAAELFGKKAKERKLDDKQIKFIKAKEESFTLEDPEKLETEVDKFMDTMLDEYKETAKIFGHKIKEEPKEEEEEPKGGAESVETGSEDENPLIPD